MTSRPSNMCDLNWVVWVVAILSDCCETVGDCSSQITLICEWYIASTSNEEKQKEKYCFCRVVQNYDFPKWLNLPQSKGLYCNMFKICKFLIKRFINRIYSVQLPHFLMRTCILCPSLLDLISSLYQVIQEKWNCNKVFTNHNLTVL